MRQTLTLEKLKTLWPCDDKYLRMFGEHESMNIEQAFDAGFTISNICWLMGVLGKRKEIIAFANFCVKQDFAAADWADKAADWADKAAINTAAFAAARAAKAAGYSHSADIHKEQKQFLMELLK